MPYFVTYGAAAGSGVSTDPPTAELADALAHACRLIDEGRLNVVISDGGRKAISGEDLRACCRGDKEITADLGAVAVDEQPDA